MVNSEIIATSILCLPLSTDLDNYALELIVKIINEKIC